MASIRKAVISQFEHNGDFHVRLFSHCMTRSNYRRNAIFFFLLFVTKNISSPTDRLSFFTEAIVRQTDIFLMMA